MHVHLRIMMKLPSQRDHVFRVKLAARQSIPGTHDRPDQGGRSWIKSEGLHELQIVPQSGRLVCGRLVCQKPPDTRIRLASPLSGVCLKVIPTHAGVCIQHKIRRGLACKEIEKPYQQGMLEAVCEVPG